MSMKRIVSLTILGGIAALLVAPELARADELTIRLSPPLTVEVRPSYSPPPVVVAPPAPPTVYYPPTTDRAYTYYYATPTTDRTYTYHTYTYTDRAPVYVPTPGAVIFQQRSPYSDGR